MFITPVKNNFYNQCSFTSKVKKVMYGSVPDELKDKVDEFEETDGKNAEEIGKGLQATAYQFLGTDWVIKKSNDGKAKKINGDFGAEAKSLMMIPKKFKHTQKLIGNVQTEDGNWYLLTTFVDGRPPDGKEVKWTGKSLSSLLGSLAELDAARVYHGDVSSRNCLITKGNKVNILDFQYSDKFGIETEDDHRINADKYKVPYFIAPSNAQMFEEATFGTYLSELDPDEAKALYKTYLKEKSLYHKKRAEEFKKQNARTEIVEYENLMSKYLENPSDEIIDIQASKLQILMSHRNIVAATDGFLNIVSVIPYYLEAIEKSNELCKKTSRLAANEQDEELKKLYEYENEQALFWRSMMKNEADGRYGKSSAFEWILRNAAKQPYNDKDDISKLFIKTGDKPYIKTVNIKGTLTDESEIFGFETEQDNYMTRLMREYISDLRKTSSFHVFKTSPSYEPIKEFHGMKEAIIKDMKEALNLYTEGRKNDAVFYSLSALYKTVCAEEKASELIKKGILKDYETDKIRHDKDALAYYSNAFKNLNRELYISLFKKASGEQDDY